MRTETFYFIAFIRNRQALTVIDLAFAQSWEKHDWDVACDETFGERDAAIIYARKLAEKHGLKYDLFDSRYDESLNERLVLIEDEEPEPSPI